MKPIIIAAIIFPLGASFASAQPGNGANKFGWYTDYTISKAEAKKTGKPIFLVFRCEP